MKKKELNVLMQISLRVAKMQMAGTLTREKFTEELDLYIQNGGKGDILQGFLMQAPAEWSDAYFAARKPTAL